MATFSDIKTRVQRALIDVPTSITLEVPDLINEALTSLQNRHDFWVMQKTASFTTTVDTRVLGAVPSDWKENHGDPYYTSEEGMVYDMSYAPRRFDAADYRSTTDDGPPELLLHAEQDDLGAGNFEVYPLPDGASDFSDGEYRITVPYWRYLPRLTADADTNWFLQQDDAIQFLIREATANGFELNEDDVRSDRWMKRQETTYHNLLLLDKMRWVSLTETLVPHLGARGAKLSR